MSFIWGYIRVSTEKQDRENQKHGILEYANKHGLSPVKFTEETISSRKKLEQRKIWHLVEHQLNHGDILIVSEISRLGRSVSEVMAIFQKLIDKEITTHIIKGGHIIGGGDNKIQSTVFIFAFSLAAEIERELISQRTKEALARKKAEGVQLGRPPGRAQRVKLTDKKEEIEAMLAKGISKTNIAKLLECSRTTLNDFIKREGLDQVSA